MSKEIYEQALNTARNMNADNIKCATLRNLKGKSAEDILQECGQETKTSVDLNTILDKLNLITVATTFEELEKKEEYQQLGEISGLVLTNDDQVGIFFNKNDSEHRKKFTIAHEIAHCCLHGDTLDDGYVEFRNNANSMDTREIAANTFAGELLVPKKNLKYALDKLNKPSLKILAEIFDVSVQVMRARLIYLGIKYCGDVISENTGE